MISHILILLVIISATLHIHAGYKNKPYLTYIFKPLTILLIILISIFQELEVTAVYQYLIITGLVFALLGDIFLMLPEENFLYGLASFFVTHLFYMLAFINASLFPVNYAFLIPGLFVGLIILKLLLPHAGSKKIPIIIYSIILVLLLWQASGRLYETATHSAVFAFTGTVLFIFSDVT